MNGLNKQEKSFEATVELSLDGYDNIISENEKLKKLIIGIASSYSDPYQETGDLKSAIGVLLSRTSPEKMIGKIGENVYLSNKSNLEQKHWGKYVVIDPDNEEIIAIESSPAIAMIEAKKVKDKNYFLRKIGMNTLIN